jgi:hypothetical protein
VLKTENFFPLFPRKTKNEKLNFVLLIRKPTGKTFVPTDRLKKQSDLCFVLISFVIFDLQQQQQLAHDHGN